MSVLEKYVATVDQDSAQEYLSESEQGTQAPSQAVPVCIFEAPELYTHSLHYTWVFQDSSLSLKSEGHGG